MKEKSEIKTKKKTKKSASKEQNPQNEVRSVKKTTQRRNVKKRKDNTTSVLLGLTVVSFVSNSALALEIRKERIYCMGVSFSTCLKRRINQQVLMCTDVA